MDKDGVQHVWRIQTKWKRGPKETQVKDAKSG